MFLSTSSTRFQLIEMNSDSKSKGGDIWHCVMFHSIVLYRLRNSLIGIFMRMLYEFIIEFDCSREVVFIRFDVKIRKPTMVFKVSDTGIDGRTPVFTYKHGR
jgi:hypothetical protein